MFEVMVRRRDIEGLKAQAARAGIDPLLGWIEFSRNANGPDRDSTSVR